MINKLFMSWMVVVAWSIIVREVLGYPENHVLNWGGAICVLMAMLQLFSDKS